MDTNVQKIKAARKLIEEGGNVIKTRDDRELIYIDKDGKVVDAGNCEWGLNQDEKINNAIFRKRIEPWLTSLFQSEHLSLLCGSGVTNAISNIAKAGDGASMKPQEFSVFKNEIDNAAKISANKSGRGEGNIEDQIRAANDFLRGLKIMKNDEDAAKLETDLNGIIDQFANSILLSEKAIAIANP